MRRLISTSTLLALLGLVAGCGPNRSPSKPEIDIEPAMPDTEDNLRLVITEPSVDPDGDELFYETRWYQDGEVRLGVMGDVVPAGRTQAGEYWIAELWATDGELDSAVAEATVFVFNTAPEAQVRITPARANTSVDLVAHAAARDLDGHEVSFDYAWSVDGVPSGHSEAVVPASDTARDEVWTVEVLPYDGDSWGAAVSADVTIANSPPSRPVVGFEPAAPMPGREDFACVLLEEVVDPDDDELSFRVELLLEGAPFEDAATSEIEGDTVPAEHAERGQRWECRIWASDGELETGFGAAELQLEGRPPA
jgi:hypothetical protein